MFSRVRKIFAFPVDLITLLILWMILFLFKINSLMIFLINQTPKIKREEEA